MDGVVGSQRCRGAPGNPIPDPLVHRPYYAWYCTPQRPVLVARRGNSTAGLGSLGRWFVRLTGHSNSSNMIRVSHAQVLHSTWHEAAATTDEHAHSSVGHPPTAASCSRPCARRRINVTLHGKIKRRNTTVQPNTDPTSHLCSWHRTTTPKRTNTTFPPQPAAAKPVINPGQDEHPNGGADFPSLQQTTHPPLRRNERAILQYIVVALSPPAVAAGWNATGR